MPDLPDFFSNFIAKGWDGAAFRTIKVTETGEMYILVSALFEEGITGLQCDEFGNLRMNVKAQDLAEVINRPKYGGALFSSAGIAIPGDSDRIPVHVVGKGVTYGGYLIVNHDSTKKHNSAAVKLDGTLGPSLSYEGMVKNGITQIHSAAFYITAYDETDYHYVICLTPFITFETEFEIHYWNTGAGIIALSWNIMYAII